MEGTVDQLTLGGSNVLNAFLRPVTHRICVLADNPFTRTGGIEQDSIKGFRQGGTKYPTIKMRECRIAHATAADVGMQNFDTAGGVFVSENAALIVHQRSDLRSFGTRRSGDVHDQDRLRIVGKQRGHRQNGTSFLYIKKPRQMRECVS